MYLRICGSSANFKKIKSANLRICDLRNTFGYRTYDQLGSLGGSLRYHVELQRPMVGDKTNLKQN
jgi:hypothetical protein